MLMKLNQFARLTPDFKVQVAELKQIGLQADPDDTFSQSATDLFNAFFPEAYTLAAKKDKLAQVAVNMDQTLAAWLAKKPSKMTRRDFYNVALQLLGFEAFTDFDLNDPFKMMTATKLPSLDHDLTSTADLLKAVYLLLNTRTKHLVSYLDDLANRGFFKGLPEKTEKTDPPSF